MLASGASIRAVRRGVIPPLKLRPLPGEPRVASPFTASSFLVPPAAREKPEAKIWPEAVYLAGGSVSEVAFDHPHGEIRIFSPFVHKLSRQSAFRFNRLNGAFLNAGG